MIRLMDVFNIEKFGKIIVCRDDADEKSNIRGGDILEIVSKNGKSGVAKVKGIQMINYGRNDPDCHRNFGLSIAWIDNELPDDLLPSSIIQKVS